LPETTFRKHLLSILILFLIGLVLFLPTFNLAFFGDEWKAIWQVESSKILYNRYIPDTQTNIYAFGTISVYLIEKLFGHYTNFAYILSFGLRLVAALILYWFLGTRGLGRFISLISSLIFLISPVGIETTNWVKNFDSYIGIGIFLVIINSVWSKLTAKNIAITSSLMSLLLLINPIRAHGVVIIFIALLLIRLILNFKNDYKKVLVIFSIFGLFIIILNRFGMLGGQGYSQYFAGEKGFNNLSTKILSFDWYYLSDLFISVSNSLLPQTSVLPIYYLSILLLVLTFSLSIKNRLSKLLFISLIGLSSLYILIFHLSPLTPGALGLQIFASLLLLSIIFIISKQKEEILPTVLITLLPISFMVYPWLSNDKFHVSADHRYLIYSALAIPLLIAYALQKVISLKRSLLRLAVFLVTIVTVLSYYSLTQQNVQTISKGHNIEYTKIIWSQINNQIGNYDFNSKRPLFYFLTDDGGRYHDTIQFGFGYHIGLHHKIWTEDGFPFLIEDPKTLYQLITDEQAAHKYLNVDYQYLPEDIFVFMIKGKMVKRLRPEEYLPIISTTELN
jgi:hypothetical protein